MFAHGHEPMHRLAFVLLGSDSEAADVVQDAFVAITPRLDSTDDVGGELRSEVARGLRRRLAYRSAWQPKRDVADERLSPRGGSGPSGSEHLEELVGELPEREHLAVVLRHYADWSTSDIGQALECPAEDVGSLLGDSLLDLGEQLGMSEFDQLEQALSAELDKVAARAHPRSDAWERFAATGDQDALIAIEPVDASPPLHSDALSFESSDAQPDGPGPPPARDRERDNSTERTAQWRWVVLSAAAVAVAVVVVRVAVSNADTDALPADIELRGADGNDDAVAAFAAVNAAYDAFNSGDGIAWALSAAPQPAVETDALRAFDSYMAAGAHYSVEHCDYIGFDTYEVEDNWGDPSVETHRFDCDATMTDALTTASGIDLQEETRWLVDRGRVVDSVSTAPNERALRRFAFGFTSWIAREHPGLISQHLTYTSYPNAKDMPAAIELLDDYIASDDRSPETDR